MSAVGTTNGAPNGRVDVTTPARWELIESLFHDVLARPAEERQRYLDAVCTDDVCRREVLALVQAHERPGILDKLSAAVMAPLLAAIESTPAAARGLPTLGRYRIVGRLGGGGMGVVYRAHDERLEREVALKFLSPHLSSDAAAKKRFLVEARAAASLEHPNICTVHEIGETDDGQLYIVMGCYDGETLDRRIARRPLSVSDAVRIASDVARGLAKAHDRGIVHRDVKPANIMITADGVVKILDFGIAKLGDAALTQTGIAGTISYMSPEQAFGETVDRRTDVWAVGVVLYEMLAGVRPFSGPGDQALLFSILTQEPEPLTEIRADTPPEIGALLKRALAKRPTDRFPSAHELLAELIEVPVPSAARERGNSGGEMPVATRSIDSPLTGAGERRQATIVVTAIADYATLIERLPGTEIDRITTAVRDAAAEAATRYGGIVNHFAGDDAVMLFGVAATHEDDFLRGVLATLALHARVREIAGALEQREGIAIRMRSGVHTGPVVAQRQRSGDRRFRITGSPLDVAARLRGLAQPDVVLLSQECHRLVAPFVEMTPGPPVPMQVNGAPATSYRAVRESDVQTRLEYATRIGLTPYAGRSRELSQLEEMLAAVSRDGGSVAIVIGEAGSGKSRLLYELRRRVDASSARLLIGRCDAYAGTTPYLPFVQAMRDLLGLDDSGQSASEQQRVVAGIRAVDPSLGEFLPLYLALLSIPSDDCPLPAHLQGEQLHAGMLKAIAALLTMHARRRATVLLLEDWHWADDASRRALEQLAEVAPAYPLLVVVSCRPDTGVAWTAADRRALVHLGPLNLDASLEIMRAVLGAARVSPDLARKLHDRTGGNPFFLEETCHALREEGAVVVREGEAVAVEASGSIQLPETVQAVIRTRLDRLDGEARDALRVASVIGREFSRVVLDETAGLPHDLTRALDRLRGSGLIQQTSVAPEPLYRFKHVLTQEVAYDTLLEHQRKTLHGAAGRVIERRYADRLEEHLERLAHHFSRAEEWRDAIRYGIRSAERASALSQLSDALATLERVQEWLPRLANANERHELTVDVLLRQERLCETLGLRQRQVRIVEELITLLAPLGASAKLAEAYLRQGDVCTLLRRFDAAERALTTALRMSRERADRAAERNVLRSVGLLHSHAGRLDEAIESFEGALAIDRELGEAGAAAGDLASLGNIFRKVGRHSDALHALTEALDGLTSEANWAKSSAVRVIIGTVHRELGDVETALQLLEGLEQEAVEHMNLVQASFALSQVAHIHLQQGRVEESLQTYRRAVDMTRRGGHVEGLVQALRAAGEVLVGLGRHGEALPFLREAAGLFAQLEDHETEAFVWSRIATAHERCSQPADAHAAWESACALFRRIGDVRGEVRALEGIARATRSRTDSVTSIPLYEEALRRAVQIGDHERELSIRNSLGILLWESGAYSRALTQYEAALRLCRELGDHMHEGLVLNSLGATLLRLRRLEEARTALEQAAELNSATGHRQLQAHSLATLGDVCLAIGRTAEAQRYVEASLALRRELGDRRGEGWMLERLARVLDTAGSINDAAVARATSRRIAEEIGDTALTAALH